MMKVMERNGKRRSSDGQNEKKREVVQRSELTFNKDCVSEAFSLGLNFRNSIT